MTAPTTYCDECGASNPLQATYCFACHTALQPPAPSLLLPLHTANASMLRETRGGPLAPSYLLHARYSIVSQVGTGGFGAVYQAHDTLFSHRLVAIKEMSQDGLSPRELAEASAAFEREALVLTNLTHPNLPRIHDHFSEHGRSYVVMDFIAGGTLEDYLDTGARRLPAEAALDIGLQLSTVLDYLHSHQPPLIFRDLKPANIMHTAGNHVYLIDFGIARHFKPGKVKDTIPLGSKGYAAPEQYGKAQTTPNRISTASARRCTSCSRAMTLHSPFFTSSLSNCANRPSLLNLMRCSSRCWRWRWTSDRQVWQSSSRNCSASLPSRRFQCLALCSK